MRRILLIVIGVICFTLTSSVGYFWYTDDKVPTLTINSKAEFQEFMYHMFKVPEVNAQNLDYSIAEINQYLGEVEAIGVLNGLITSDGARIYSAYIPVQAISEPGSPNEIPSESAIVTYVQSQASGEVNFGANAGTGEGNVYRDKTGSVLNFRSIKAGANIAIVQTADQIEISTTPGVGEANTGANVGTGEGAIYQGKSGVILNFKRLQAGANIALNDTGNEIVITGQAGGGGGNVTGPGSSVDSTIPRWNGVTGEVLKNSNVLIDDSDNITGVNSITVNATSNPTMPIRDSDAPGSNKTIAQFGGEYVSGADGFEDGEISQYVKINGTMTEVVKIDGYGVFQNFTNLLDQRSRGTKGFIHNSAGTISFGQAVYINPASANAVSLANATNGQTTWPAVGIAVSNATVGTTVKVLQSGVIRNDTWNWSTTPPSFVYLDKTNGSLTQNIGAYVSGDCIQIIGRALNADTLLVDVTNSFSNK